MTVEHRVGFGGVEWCGCGKAATSLPLQPLFNHFKTRLELHVIPGLNIKKILCSAHTVYLEVSISEQTEITSPHMKRDRNLAQTSRNQNRKRAKSQMHLDIFGSHMECHIPSPNYISKFFNTHTHTWKQTPLLFNFAGLAGCIMQ